MNIMEIFSREIGGFQDGSDDNSVKHKCYPRQSSLKLSQINALRRMNDIREIEDSRKIEKLSKQYAATPASDVGGIGL